MGSWEKHQEEKKEGRERDKTRRETQGKFFYDLAKLTFAGLVIGGFSLFNEDSMGLISIVKVIAGGTSTIIFAWIGNLILK